MKITALLLTALCCVSNSVAATKAHVVAFGKWTSVKLGADQNSAATDLKIRPLFVDGKTKEFTLGAAHDVTDRTFVVQRAFRLNDSLPEDSGPPRWRWQKGGWLAVDRISGKIQQLNVPDFDPDHSQASWFRDYAAYCGASDDGQKTYVLVVQLGRRRPLLKKLIGEGQSEMCAAPLWRRDPVRVVFRTEDDPALTFAVTSRFVDLLPQDDEGEE